MLGDYVDYVVSVVLGNYVDYVISTQLLFCLYLNVVVIELFAIHYAAFAYNANNALALVASTLASSTTGPLFEAMIARNVFCVPHVVVKFVWSVAKRATIMHGTITILILFFASDVLSLSLVSHSTCLAVYYCPFDVFWIWFTAAGEEKKNLVY